MNFEYACAHGFYEWLAATGQAKSWKPYWRPGLQQMYTQAQMNIVTRKLCPKKLLLHFANKHVYQCHWLSVYPGCDQSITHAARHVVLFLRAWSRRSMHVRVFSFSRAWSMHVHVMRANNHIGCYRTLLVCLVRIHSADVNTMDPNPDWIEALVWMHL